MSKADTAKKTKPELLVRDLSTDKVTKTTVPEWLQLSAPEVLLVQSVQVGRNRQRILRAHTKGRSEVRGGGAKPWKQKGTGRARHGSRRSPIWVGGGITFGPRSIKSRLPRLTVNMKKLALAGALSEKLAAGQLEIVQISQGQLEKSKDVQQVLGNKHGVLLVVPEDKEKVIRAARNVTGVTAKICVKVNVRDVLGARLIKIDENCLDIFARRISVNAGKVSALKEKADNSKIKQAGKKTESGLSTVEVK